MLEINFLLTSFLVKGMLNIITMKMELDIQLEMVLLMEVQGDKEKEECFSMMEISISGVMENHSLIRLLPSLQLSLRPQLLNLILEVFLMSLLFEDNIMDKENSFFIKLYMKTIKHLLQQQKQQLLQKGILMNLEFLSGSIN